MMMSKEKIEVKEVDNEGLISLLNQNAFIMCLNHTYVGKLVGVNDTCVKLENPGIVFLTGNYNDDNWKELERLPADFWYVQHGCIESFGPDTKS